VFSQNEEIFLFGAGKLECGDQVLSQSLDETTSPPCDLSGHCLYSLDVLHKGTCTSTMDIDISFVPKISLYFPYLKTLKNCFNF
jgi:hypothetical protein